VKKFLLILPVLGIVAAIVYAFGTASGRARRDDLLRRAKRNSASDDNVEIDLSGASNAVEDVVAADSPTG
jgi:hypothetical protein